MARQNYRKLTQKQKSMTYQYLKSLEKSLNRVNGPDFQHLNVKIRNPQLAKLLLCICLDKKLHLPSYVEELLIEKLSKNKSYEYYFDQGLEVSIKQQSSIHFYREPKMCTQDERQKGHSERTAS